MAKVDFRCFLTPKRGAEPGSCGATGSFLCLQEGLVLSIQANGSAYCHPQRDLKKGEDPTVYEQFEIAFMREGSFDWFNPAVTDENPSPKFWDGTPIPEAVSSAFSPWDNVAGYVSYARVQEIFDLVVDKDKLTPQSFSWDETLLKAEMSS